MSLGNDPDQGRDRPGKSGWLCWAFCLLDAGWESVKYLWVAVRPARVSLAVVVAAGSAFLFVRQGQDVLIEMTEDKTDARWLLFLGGLLWLGLVAWGWARSAMTLAGKPHEPPGPDRIPAKIEELRHVLPRLIGRGALLPGRHRAVACCRRNAAMGRYARFIGRAGSYRCSHSVVESRHRRVASPLVHRLPTGVRCGVSHRRGPVETGPSVVRCDVPGRGAVGRSHREERLAGVTHRACRGCASRKARGKKESQRGTFSQKAAQVRAVVQVERDSGYASG